MSSKFTGEPEKAINSVPARTAWFSEKELRLMIACFRKGGDSVRDLLTEFDKALDARIKAKLGLVDAPDNGREITE